MPFWYHQWRRTLTTDVNFTFFTTEEQRWEEDKRYYRGNSEHLRRREESMDWRGYQEHRQCISRKIRSSSSTSGTVSIWLRYSRIMFAEIQNSSTRKMLCNCSRSSSRLSQRHMLINNEKQRQCGEVRSNSQAQRRWYNAENYAGLNRTWWSWGRKDRAWIYLEQFSPESSNIQGINSGSRDKAAVHRTCCGWLI